VHFNDIISNCICSGVAGNMSIAGLKICPRRGDSPLEGVGFDHQPATYFWHPVSKSSPTATDIQTVSFVNMSNFHINRRGPAEQPKMLLTNTVLPVWDKQSDV